MTLAAGGLVAVALALTWWLVRRAIRFRREAQSREARVLEALFISRHAADGGASIDVNRIFGGTPQPAVPTSADEVLRAVDLHADIVVRLQEPAVALPAGGLATPAAPKPSAGGPAHRAAVLSASPAACEPAEDDQAALVPPAPVRDLVQVFYEARGFRAAPADPPALPIESVLAHKSDGRRAYAFVPLQQPPSPSALQSIIKRARGIGQARVLIAVEGDLAPGAELEVPAHGVRVLDRAAIEAQLARLEADVADRIRGSAWRRAGRRLREG